jgi:hypothetical protein
MYVKLSATKEEQDKAQKGISRVENFNKSSKIKLTKKERERLTKYVEEYYREWDDATASKRNRLIELNDIIEGKEEPTDFPYGVEDSSQINLKLASASFKSFRAIFRSGIFDNPNLFVAKSNNPKRDSINLAKQERAIYWLALEGTNLLSTLKDTDLPCYRDGMALIHGQWVRQTEKGVDYKVYNELADFILDYPSAESAGIKQNKYNEIKKVLENPEEEEVVVEYDIDFIKKDNAEFKLFPLANFIYYPYFVEKMSDLTIYGFLYKETTQELRIKIENDFYDDNAEELVKTDTGSNDKSSAILSNDFYDKSRERAEGVESDKDDVIEIAKINVKFDLDEDNIPEKYTVYYHHTKKQIIRCERYKIRLNIPDIVGFKIIARDGRFLGISILDETSDLFSEVNALHRHRSNVRRLTDAPVILIPESLKSDFTYNVFKPGSPLYLPDQMLGNNGIAPRQLQLFNVDNTRTSVDEEVMIQRHIETLIGPTQGLSGQIDPADPRAPGNKTQMLLQQANSRITDYKEEWKRAIPDMLDLLIALYYQNSKSKINFIERISGKDSVAEIDINDFIGKDTRFHLSANTPSLSPELEMSRIAIVMQSAINFGIVKNNPQILDDGWNIYVAASKIAAFEKFLIPDQKTQQEQQAKQAQQQQLTQIPTAEGEQQ